jgi:hypothetical protein
MGGELPSVLELIASLLAYPAFTLSRMSLLLLKIVEEQNLKFV